MTEKNPTKQPKIIDVIHELESWWAIRLTVDELDLEKTYSLFNYWDKFIVSEEGDGINTRVHHHILLVSTDTSDFIKEKIRSIYPNAKGNKCIYVRPSKDKKQLAKYTLKEGNYLYKGFSDKYILDTFCCSIPKTNLKRDIIALEDQLVLHEISYNQFINSYIDLKVKHDQNLYMSHIKAYCLKIAVRANIFPGNHLGDNLYSNIENEFHRF